MTIKLIVDFIIALPQVYKIFAAVVESIKKLQEAKKEKKHDEALEGLKNAKTIDEQKAALDNLVDNP